MSKLLKAIAGVGLAALLPAASAVAAPVLSLTRTYVGYSTTNAPANSSYSSAVTPESGLPGFYRFQYSLGFTGDVPSDDFANVGLNFVLSNGLNSVSNAWRPLTQSDTPALGSVQRVDNNFNPVFDNNRDAGSSTSDLQGILLSTTSPGAFDTQPGEAGTSQFPVPLPVGLVTVQYDGTSAAELDVETAGNFLFSIWANNNGERIAPTDVAPGGGTFVAPAPVAFVPEPAALSLLGVGAAVIFGRRRRK